MGWWCLSRVVCRSQAMCCGVMPSNLKNQLQNLESDLCELLGVKGFVKHEDFSAHDGLGFGSGLHTTDQPLSPQVAPYFRREDSTNSQLIVNTLLPRLGTFTPWGAKALEIVTQRVTSIQRIERVLLGQDVGLRKHDPMVENWVQLWQLRPLLQDIPAEIGIERGELPEREPWRSWLEKHYATANRDPTVSELQMFAQINSEHCRHHIFRGAWRGRKESLMQMIRATSTTDQSGEPDQYYEDLLSCYADNAAVIRGFASEKIYTSESAWINTSRTQHLVHLVLKAETHNHPTGIAPWPGAATGVGGEIRDESATGCGASSVAGFAGYITSGVASWQCLW